MLSGGLVCAVVGWWGQVLSLCSGGKVLDSSHQGLHFFSLGLVRGGEDNDLCPEYSDVLLQEGEASCHRSLYLGQVVFQVVVVVI